MNPLIDIPQTGSFETRFHAACPPTLLQELAEKSRFSQRPFRKISPLVFIAGLACGTRGALSSSLNTIAQMIAAFTGKLVSKQALAKRISPRAAAFLQLVLKAAIAYPLNIDVRQCDHLLRLFKHVWLVDSTTISLHASLVDFFPGSRNQTQKQSAIVKIQLAYELLSGTLDGISISPYTRNDQSASGDIFALARAGDLVIRDLGYLTLAAIQTTIATGIFFISRLSPQIAIFDWDSHPIDLLTHLKSHPPMESDVLIGAHDQIKPRLIAIPRDQNRTQRRIQKAQADRHAKTNHAAHDYELLGWSIDITNIPATTIGASLIALIYSLRWKIEIIFKIWKSYFRITHIPKASVTYVQCLIYAQLILIILSNHTYICINHAVYRQTQRALSPLEFGRFIAHSNSLLTLPWRSSRWRFTRQEFFAYYPSYEKRKKRRNLAELIAALQPQAA